MKALMLVVAGTLALAPLAATAQDHAVPRGGGDGGSSSGGGGGHPSSSSAGSSGGSSSGSSYSGGGSSSSGGSYAPSTAAERRHPSSRAGSGGYSGYSGRGGYYYPGYADRWYYPGWSGSYWWPYGSYGWYGGYWGGGYWGYPYGGGNTIYHRYERETGAIRVLVDPPEARVYVDGYYAGVVDDFDGLFQRLNVSPGRHEITLKLEGYKSHRMKVYVSPDSTLKLRYDLQKGSGETFEDLAGNVSERELRRERERTQRETDQDRERWEMRERRDADEALPAAGRVKLSVQPPDASVYVDGAFRGAGREASVLRLPAGRHRIELVRPGYRTVEKDVEVAPNETTELSVDLEKGAI